MYAEGTVVTAEKSRAEIEKVLAKYGAKNRLVFTNDDAGEIQVSFEIAGKRVLMSRNLPSAQDRKMSRDTKGYTRTAKQTEAAVDKETRRRWRAMLLKVKVRLEDAFSEEHVTPEEKARAFYDNFGMDVVLPGNRTLAHVVLPQIEEAYGTGRPVAGLLEGGH